MRAIPCLLLSLLLTVTACGSSDSDGVDSGEWALHCGLAASDRLEYTLTDPRIQRRFRLRFPELTRLAEEATPKEMAAEESAEPSPFLLRLPGEESDPDAVRVIVSAVEEEMAIALAEPLGLELLDEGGFRLLGRDFTAPGDALHAVFEDPDRPSQPLGLWIGNDAVRLARYVQELTFAPRPWLRAWGAGDIALECPLERDGTPRRAEWIDHRSAQGELLGQALPLTLSGINYHVLGAIDVERSVPYAVSLTKVRDKVTKWMQPKGSVRLNVYLYGNPEDLARATGGKEAPHLNPVIPTVHVLLSPAMVDDAGSAVARATALALGGEPVAPWLLDGVGVAAVGTWWGRNLDEWVGGLQLQGLVPTVAEITDPTADERISPHILMPLRGFLLRTVLSVRGPRRLESLWSGAAEFTMDDAMRRAWNRALPQAANRASRTGRFRGDRRRRILRAPFRHGVALVQTMEAEVSGYLSPGLATSLGQAREIGADAFSVTVLAANEVHRSPHPFGETRPVRGSTSDLSLAHAIGLGRLRGMRAMLVVEPVTSLSAAREQGSVLHEKEDWRAFFADFRSIALHYGLLAELLGCEVMCLGTELITPSRTRPADGDPEWKEEACAMRLEGWSSVIAETRKVFTGALTYGAREREDAGRIAFWNQLDFLGVHLYPSWRESSEEEPGYNRMRGAYRYQLLGLAEVSIAEQRPFLLIQTGFPSTADAWKRSSVPLGPSRPELQAKAYDALTEALRNGGRGHPELAGYYLWYWSTDPEAGGVGDRGFTPQNKEAADSLPALFRTPR